jgi:hypothetical protein
MNELPSAVASPQAFATADMDLNELLDRTTQLVGLAELHAVVDVAFAILDWCFFSSTG